jgi:hypothetical protein
MLTLEQDEDASSQPARILPSTDATDPCKLLKGLRCVPRVLVTDKLASYPAARRRVMPGVEHRRSKYLNNRVENSHQPTRQRERAMKKFRSPGGAQRFLSAFSGISPHFRHADIDSPHPATAMRWIPDSQHGTRSSACPQPPDPGRHRATSPVRTTRPPPTLNNLIMP